MTFQMKWRGQPKGEGFTIVPQDALKRSAWVFAAVLVAGLCTLGVSHGAPIVPPVIEHPESDDADGNLIEDQLESQVGKMAAEGKPEALVRLEVVLYEPYRPEDLETFRSLGGTVIHTFEAVSYGFSGTFPADRIDELAAALSVDGRLCVIADDPQVELHLDYSVRHIRARTTPVWGAGYQGNSDTTIAILDTGIDDTHIDFSGRLSAGWTDTTNEAFPSPVDQYGHGSHVAGIALGSGAAIGSGPLTSITTTESGNFPPFDGFGYFDVVEVKNTGTDGLQLDLNWTGTGTTQVSALNPSWAWMAFNNSAVKPNVISYNITATGTYRPFFGNVTGAANEAYSALQTANYSAVGDGYNLFRGIAPACTLVGVKVFPITGFGNSTDIGEGLDWCVANRDTYNIRVINMSLGGGLDEVMDSKVANTVTNGIVVVCSAGNDFPFDTIGSPANAAKCIAVGAINDDGQMTNFSSNGFTGQKKPDVVAPGGSRVAKTEVTSVESNDGDAGNQMADRNRDDYFNARGTSMSSPMVAGLAGLLVDAQEQSGDPWNSTEAEALRIKSIILMTATELNEVGEKEWNGGELPVIDSGNDPTLDRGNRDLVEGFGKVNADAAVEAFTLDLPIDSSTQVSFGADQLDRKAAARKVQLTASSIYDFILSPISGNLDCDLYLYRGAPDADGNPIIQARAANAILGGTEEILGFIPATTGTYYLVAKYVVGSGTGEYLLEAALPPPLRAAIPIMPFSPRTQVIGIHLTDPAGASAVKEITVRFRFIQDETGGIFDPEEELMPLSNTTESGVAIYRDLAGSAGEGAFDFEEDDPTGNDPLLTPVAISGFIPDGTDAYRLTFTFDAFDDPLTRVPADPDEKPDFFVVVRTSGNMAHAHAFQVTIPPLGILGLVRAGQNLGETYFEELGYDEEFPPVPATWIGEIIKLTPLTTDTVVSTVPLVKQVTGEVPLVGDEYKVVDRQSAPVPVIGINAYGPRRQNYRLHKVVVTFDQVVRAVVDEADQVLQVYPEAQRFTPAALADLSDTALSGVSLFADHPNYQDGVFEPENDLRIPVNVSLLAWQETVSGVRWRLELEPDPVLAATLTRIPANDTDPGNRGADFFVAIRTGDRIHTGDTFLVTMIEHRDEMRGVQIINGQDSLFWSRRLLSDTTLPSMSPISCHARPAFQYSDLTVRNPVVPKLSSLTPVVGIDCQDYGADLASPADGFRLGIALDTLAVDFINVGGDLDFTESDLLDVISGPVFDPVLGLAGGVMLFMDDSTPQGDGADDDADGVTDEELLDNADNDGDGLIDEDVGDDDPAGVNGEFDPYDDFLPFYPGHLASAAVTRYATDPQVLPLADGTGFRVNFRLVFQREGESNARCLLRRVPPITGPIDFQYRVLSQIFVFNPSSLGFPNLNNQSPLSDGTGVGPYAQQPCTGINVNYTYGMEIPNDNDPGGPNFGDDFFVVIRSSETANDGDDFQVRINPGGLSYYWIENALTSNLPLDNQISQAHILTEPVVITAPVEVEFTGLVPPAQRIDALTDGEWPIPMLAIDMDVHSELNPPSGPALSGEFLEGIAFDLIDTTNTGLCPGHRFTVTKSGADSDLLPVNNTGLSGILVFQDNGTEEGALDLSDEQMPVLLSSSSITHLGGGIYRVTLKFADPLPIPANQEGEYVGPDLYVAVRASKNLEYLDSFRLRINVGGFRGTAPFAGGEHTTYSLTAGIRTFLTDVSPEVNALGQPGTLLPITGVPPEPEYRRSVLGINVAACEQQQVYVAVLHGFIESGVGFDAFDLLPLDGATPGLALYRDYSGDGIDDDDDGEDGSPVDGLGRKLADGVDNDLDGLTDEGIDEEIQDGIDNDGDAARLQSNGIDDDGDGEDGSPTDLRGRKLADGLDNDGDGEDGSPEDAAGRKIADGIDNDGDGLTDEGIDEGIDELDEGIDEDSIGAPQQFDPLDQLVPIDPLTSVISNSEFILRLQRTSGALVPGTDDGHELGDDFFLVVHASNTAEPGETFQINIPPRGLVFTVGSTGKSIDLRPVQFVTTQQVRPESLTISPLGPPLAAVSFDLDRADICNATVCCDRPVCQFAACSHQICRSIAENDYRDSPVWSLRRLKVRLVDITTEFGDGIDNDRDGIIDEADEATLGGDGNDNDADGLTDEEVLNGFDDDGDGSIDEDARRGFDPRIDLRPITANELSGIAVYRDGRGPNPGVFDFAREQSSIGDLLMLPVNQPEFRPVPRDLIPAGDSPFQWEAEFDFATANDPLTTLNILDDSLADFFIVVRASNLISHGDSFEVHIEPGQIYGATTPTGPADPLTPPIVGQIPPGGQEVPVRAELIDLIPIVSNTQPLPGDLPLGTDLSSTPQRIFRETHQTIGRMSPPTPVLGINALSSATDEFRLTEVSIIVDQLVRVWFNSLSNRYQAFPLAGRFDISDLNPLTGTKESGVAIYQDSPAGTPGVFEPEIDRLVPTSAQEIRKATDSEAWLITLKVDSAAAAANNLDLFPRDDQSAGNQGADFFVAVRTSTSLLSNENFLAVVDPTRPFGTQTGNFRLSQVRLRARAMNGSSGVPGIEFGSVETITEDTTPPAVPIVGRPRPDAIYQDLTNPSSPPGYLVAQKSSGIIPILGVDIQDYGSNLMDTADGDRFEFVLNTLEVDFVNEGVGKVFEADDLLPIDNPTESSLSPQTLRKGLLLFMDDDTPAGDAADSDGDGLTDEELVNGTDDDGDGAIDEDVGDGDVAGVSGVWDAADDIIPFIPGRHQAWPQVWDYANTYEPDRASTKFRSDPQVQTPADLEGFRVAYSLLIDRFDEYHACDLPQTPSVIEGEVVDRLVYAHERPMVDPGTLGEDSITRVVDIEVFDPDVETEQGPGGVTLSCYFVSNDDADNVVISDRSDVLRNGYGVLIDRTFGCEDCGGGGVNFPALEAEPGILMDYSYYVPIPDNNLEANSGNDFFLCVRTSENADHGDAFHMEVQSGGLVYFGITNAASPSFEQAGTVAARGISGTVMVEAPVDVRFSDLIVEDSRVDALLEEPLAIMGLNFSILGDLPRPELIGVDSGESILGLAIEFIDQTDRRICPNGFFDPEIDLDEIAAYLDTGSLEGAFDPGDTLIPLLGPLVVTPITDGGAVIGHRVAMDFREPIAVPMVDLGPSAGPDAFITIRTSAEISYRDAFYAKMDTATIRATAPVKSAMVRSNVLTANVPTFLTDLSPVSTPVPGGRLSKTSQQECDILAIEFAPRALIALDMEDCGKYWDEGASAWVDNATGDVYLVQLILQFINENGFSPSDLAPLSEDERSGIALYRDAPGRVAGEFDELDQLVPFVLGDSGFIANTAILNFPLDTVEVPDPDRDAVEDLDDYFLVFIRSDSADYGDAFRVTIPSNDGISYSEGDCEETITTETAATFLFPISAITASLTSLGDRVDALLDGPEPLPMLGLNLGMNLNPLSQAEPGLSEETISELVLELVDRSRPAQPPAIRFLPGGTAISLPGDAQGTSGPTPPVGISRGSGSLGIPAEHMVAGVPAYIWHRGSGPTALAMVLGYYDGNGFPDLIPGNASTQTVEVNRAISSSGNFLDYIEPFDDPGTYPTPLPDKSEPPAGDEHPDDSISDFMKASQSFLANYFGWNWFTHVPPAFGGYVRWAKPGYQTAMRRDLWGQLTWGVFTNEIDAGRPMVLLVDTDADGETDHFVTAVGYREINNGQEYACLDTWDTNVHWFDFAAIADGQDWGIHGAILLDFPINRFDFSLDPNELSDLLPVGNAYLGQGGIALWEDNGAVDGEWDAGDTVRRFLEDPVIESVTEDPVLGRTVYRIRMTFDPPLEVPVNDLGAFEGADFIFAARTSATIDYLDAFQMRLMPEEMVGSECIRPTERGESEVATANIPTFLSNLVAADEIIHLVTGGIRGYGVVGIDNRSWGLASDVQEVSLTEVQVGFTNVSGFTRLDLLPVGDPLPGECVPRVALYRDNDWNYPGDRIDNDQDGLTDEDPINEYDDDGDGMIDEDAGDEKQRQGVYDLDDLFVPLDMDRSCFTNDGGRLLVNQAAPDATLAVVLPPADPNDPLGRFLRQGPDFFLVITNSETARAGDAFQVTIPSENGINYSEGDCEETITTRDIVFGPPNVPPRLVIIEPDQPNEPLEGPPGFAAFTIVFEGSDVDDNALISLYWIPADATEEVERPIPGGRNLPENQREFDFRPSTVPGAGIDDDGDGRTDEDLINHYDDDGDGFTDEDPGIAPEVRIVGIIDDGFNPPVRAVSTGTIDTTTEIPEGRPDIEMLPFQNTNEIARTTTIAWEVTNGLGGTVDLTYVQEVGKVLSAADLNPDGTPNDEYLAQAGGPVAFGFIATGIPVRGEGVIDSLPWDYNFLPQGDFRAVGVVRRPLDTGGFAQDLDITPNLLRVPGGRRFPVLPKEKVGATPAVADLIGDISKEIVILTDQPGRLLLLSPEGRAIASIDLGSAGTASPAIADMDGDGTQEVVVALLDGDYEEAPAYLHVFDVVEGSGGQITFQRRFGSQPLEISNSGFAVVSSPAVADLFGDATKEIAVGTIEGVTGSLVIAGVDEQTGELEIVDRVDFEGRVQASPSVGQIDAGDGQGIRTEVILPVDDGYLYGISFPAAAEIEAVTRHIPQGMRIGTPNPLDQFRLNPPASASLYDLDLARPGDEIFVGTLDGKFYVLYGNGESVIKDATGNSLPALELPLFDEDGFPLDAWRREIRTTPAIGDIDGDSGAGPLDVVIAANNNRLYAFEVDPSSGATTEFFIYDDPNALPTSLDRFRRSSPTIAPLVVAGTIAQGRSNVVIGGFNGRVYSVYLAGAGTPADPYRAAKTPVSDDDDMLFNSELVSSIRATVFITDINNDDHNDIVYAGYGEGTVGSVINVIFGDSLDIPFGGTEPDWPTFQFDNTRTGRLDPARGEVSMDLNADGKVDCVDLFLLSTVWGQPAGQSKPQSVYFRTAADGVDGQDLLGLIREWKHRK